MGIKLVPFFLHYAKSRGRAKTKNDSIVKMGAGDKPAPNVCCRTPMESDPPVFFCQKGGSCRMQNGYFPGFWWVAGRAGWLHCLPFDAWIEKKNYNIFLKIIKIIISVLTLGKVYDTMRTTEADVVKNDMRPRHNRIFLWGIRRKKHESHETGRTAWSA